MARNSSTVLGIFPTYNRVDSGVDACIAAWLALKAAGFRNTRMSVISPEDIASRDLRRHKTTKAPEGALAGGGSGALLGSVLGWLAGIGSLGIPGAGSFMAAGPTATAIVGAGVGAAVAGIMGAVIGDGIRKDEVQRYEGQIDRGILLTVQPENSERVWRARQILEWTGAQDISPAEARVGSQRKPTRPRGHRLHPTGPALG